MGQFYRGGRLWSSETIRLSASKTLSGGGGGDGSMLATQAFPVSADTIHVVSTSHEDSITFPDTPATPEIVVITLAGSPVEASGAVTDEWSVALGGTPTDGDQFTVSVDATPYTATYVAADPTPIPTLFADLITAVGGGTYTPTGAGPLDLLAISAGLFAHTVAASTTSVTATFVATQIATGTDAVPASTAAVTDGTNHYTATYVGGGLAQLAIDLAGQIDAHNGYTCSPSSDTATVSGPTDYALTDESAHGVTASFNMTQAGSVDIPGGSGTGAHSVLLEYLDAAGYAQKATLALNGLTPIDGPQATWILRCTVLSAATETKATGTLTVSIASTDFVTVDAGKSQSESTAYIVPAGKQLRLTGLLATAMPGARFSVISNYDPETSTTFAANGIAVTSFLNGPTPIQVNLPYSYGPFPPGAFVAVSALGDADTRVIANLEGFLEPEGAR